MSFGVNTLGVRIGHYQLLRDDIARCPLRWTDPDRPEASCIFSVQFDSYVGETRAAREARAVAEARRIAQAFLDATATYDNCNNLAMA